MRKLSITLIVSSCLLLFCSTNKDIETKDNEVITIDVLETLNAKGTLKLSELVDDVEIIQLEGKTGAFFRNTMGLYVGREHIIVGVNDINTQKILLFNRDGSFNKTISRKGQGPGEFTYLRGVALDPKEQHVIAMEMRPKMLHLFDIEGNHIRSKDIGDYVPYHTIQGIHFLDDEHFAVAFSRPGRADSKEVFARVVIFNLQFEVIQRYLPITDPDDLSMIRLQYVWFGKSSGGLYFCEGIRDTVYYFNLNSNPTPKYYFHISEDKVTEESLRTRVQGEGKLDRKNFLWGVYDLPNHLLAHGLDKSGEAFLISYNKETDEAISCQYRDPCEITNKEKRPFIENDIFGLEPIYIRAYEPDRNFIVMDFDPSYAKEDKDIDCFRGLKVENPELRDELADIIENATGEENKILILLHLRK